MIPQTTQKMPFNEITSRDNRPPQGTHSAAPTNHRPKFKGGLQLLWKEGTQNRENRCKKRDEANQQPQGSRKEQPQRRQPKSNSKLMCNSCGYTIHSTWDCRHRTKGASAFRNVPYEKQKTDKNRNFSKGFMPSHKTAPLSEVTVQLEFSNSLESEEDQSLNWSRNVNHSKITKFENYKFMCPICHIYISCGC